MAEANSLTSEQVLSQVTYDPETGVFRWIASGKGRAGAGEVAGGLHPKLGYWVIGLFGKRMYAHRLAWLVTHGIWPSAQIDHVNGRRSDNRIANLRECSHADNQKNRHSPRQNKHGFRGVDYCNNLNRYRARLVCDKVKHNLGYFDTAEEAHAAYTEAKRRINTFASA